MTLRKGSAAWKEKEKEMRGLAQIISDPIEFCSRLCITDKKGRRIPLDLNDEQIEIILALKEGKDVLVLKARQIGSSTAVAAFFFWKWFTATGPETYVVLSHKLASAKHLLDIHKTFYACLPKAMRRPLVTEASCEMVLADTGASLVAASAGGDGGLRSFTATGLHISEFAFAEHADELKATAISALNGNQLCIESTANFFGDPLHREIQLYEGGQVDWAFLFFAWTSHRAYFLEEQDIPEGFVEDPKLMGLSIGQQAWARMMSGKLGESKFKREYPLTVDEAYAQVDGAWISYDMLSSLQTVQLPVGGGQLAAVDALDKYAIGVDAGAGTGGDNSTIVVLSATTRQPVDIRRSNQHSPTEWAEVVADASSKWNGAKVLVESNGTWGGVILAELRGKGVPLWKTTEGKDWTTTAYTKPKMLEGVKDSLQRGQLYLLDAFTVGELRSFKVSEKGEPYCPRSPIHHGDTVIALALALQCIGTVRVADKPYLPAWIQAQKVNAARQRGAQKEFRRY